jgi:hypothetical protein
MSKSFYSKYHNNIYSQNGEDGIIFELLKRLKIYNGWVCEFGAWDGIHLSNTFNLVSNMGFEGVFIEGDADKFKDLLVTQAEHPNIVAVNEYVDHDPQSASTLDKILEKTPIPKDFEVLSIDIDSFDYQVWESLENYRPKIVIIEINSAVQPDLEDYIHTPGVYSGTGFLPMYNLGVKKGYTFILHTGNMFFVRNDLYEKLNLDCSNPLDNFLYHWINAANSAL